MISFGAVTKTEFRSLSNILNTTPKKSFQQHRGLDKSLNAVFLKFWNT